MQQPRGGGGFLGKRKEREYYPPYPSASSSQAVLLQRPPPQPLARPDPRVPVKPDRAAAAAALRIGANAAKPPLPHAGAAAAGPHAAVAAAGGNKLLAGYLAHEFLRCGTLLGERRPEPPGRKEKEPAPAPEPSRRYAEVSRLLMAGGARIPGIVNPSQLGQWLRIKE